MKTKHTVVLHFCPDLEALFMTFLIRNFPAVREKLGLADEPKLKFIPAGPLRQQDWPDHDDLRPEALEADGFMFMDCGGGRLDQHDKHAVGCSMSSLDLLVHFCDFDEIAPELMPVVEIISRNDLSGKDVVRDTSYRRSPTPHTPRHLRNIVLGWNLFHKGRPEGVVCLAETAFRGLARSIDEQVNGRLAEGLPTQERFEEALSEIDFAGLFLAENLIKGVELLGEKDEVRSAAAFKSSVEKALRAMEAEWEKAVVDYWQRSTIMEASCARRINGVTVHRQITVACGHSASTRYGAVTRLGNEGRRDKLPHPGKPRRAKADVTIQFYDEGHFIIATKGIELDKVARAVRRADLMRRGVKLSVEDELSLSRTGHLEFTNLAGERVQALYLAEYGTAFGNGFRANSCAAPTALEVGEVVKLVLKALQEE